MKYKQLTFMDLPDIDVIASIEGNGSRPSHRGSGIGDGEVSFTLNATEQHGVALAEVHATLSAMDGDKCNHSQKLKNPEENYVMEPKVYGIGSKDSNAMKSGNPHSGIYEADTTRTLDLNGGNPGCNQGGMAVVETVDVRITSDGTKNARAHAYETDNARCLSTQGDDPDSNHGGVAVIEYQEQVGTLAASDYKFPQQQQVEEGKCIVEAEMNFENYTHSGYREAEQGATLKANGGDYPGGETLHESDYLVRRLTEIEAEFLQGMPAMWCFGTENDNPSEEEIGFWLDVFETHRKIVTKASKPKTEKQIRKWLKTPLTASKVYTIEGNGLALPNALFVIEGVAKAERGEL